MFYLVHNNIPHGRNTATKVVVKPTVWPNSIYSFVVVIIRKMNWTNGSACSLVFVYVTG